MADIPVNKPELRALFAKVGGESGLRTILKEFYVRMSQDILIGFFFNGKNLDEIAGRQAEFLMRAMGAKASYSGKSPAAAHAALPPILKGHFDRRLRILEEVLRSHGLQEQEVKTWIDFENAFRDAVQH